MGRGGVGGGIRRGGGEIPENWLTSIVNGPLFCCFNQIYVFNPICFCFHFCVLLFAIVYTIGFLVLLLCQNIVDTT